MKTKLTILFVFVLSLTTLTAFGQMIKRTDAIWARTTTNTITLDGKLTEPDWAVAESLKVQWGQNSLIPGSGWHNENGVNNPPADPTNATVKLLSKGDSLYVAIVCLDKSITAGMFNNFDGFLMNIRYKQATGFLKTPFPAARTNQACELFYGWVTESWAGGALDSLPGAMPGFFGEFPSAYGQPRPDSMKTKYWDAVTSVRGTVNNDSTGIPDTSWTTEVKINLKTFGYNVTQAAGDIAMWNVSIYDADYQWPWVPAKQSGNRTWLQCPWGNGSNYNHLRVFIKPSVTTTSGPVPTVGPDLVIPGSAYPSPSMDGRLDDAVWKDPNIGTLRMQYGNTSVLDGYPNTAKYRSGWRQPVVNGSLAAVVDPDTVTVKYFYQGDMLFLGFDVKDRVVQAYTPYMDANNWANRADGFRVTINDRQATDVGGDNLSLRRVMTFIVDTSGHALRCEDLAATLGGWDSAGTKVQVALAMRGETKFDTLGRAKADSGYTAEMKIDLTKVGYAVGRGDGVLFLGITHFDGDSFTDPTRNYGTISWFMREGSFDDGAAWAYMDPATTLAVGPDATAMPEKFALLGNYPNPFNPATTIRFALPKTSEVTLEVFDLLGRRVATQSLGVQQPGEQSVQFNAGDLASGVYYYRLRMASTQSTVAGKMMLVK